MSSLEESLGAPRVVKTWRRCAVAMLMLGPCWVALAQPQPISPLVTKLAITSLVGDELTVDTYQQRVGLQADRNLQRTVPMNGPLFDETAMESAARALGKALPSVPLAQLSVAKAGSDLDPEKFLVEGRIASSHRLVAALRDAGFSHLLVIAKHRAPARIRMADRNVASGQLRGLGFYVNYSFSTVQVEGNTMRVETQQNAAGFVAPYVYVRLGLVDLASLQQVRERAIAEGVAETVTLSQGSDAWSALSSQDKMSMLQALLRRTVEEAVPALLESASGR